MKAITAAFAIILTTTTYAQSVQVHEYKLVSIDEEKKENEEQEERTGTPLVSERITNLSDEEMLEGYFNDFFAKLADEDLVAQYVSELVGTRDQCSNYTSKITEWFNQKPTIRHNLYRRLTLEAKRDLGVLTID